MNSDSWETPQCLFDELNQEFNFYMDLCATAENSKCLNYCVDYLSAYIMNNTTCFMNPPYSNPKPFIEKAWEDSKHCKIVLLLPNTIKTCKYMDILDGNNGNSTFRKWKAGVEIRDLTRRTKFVHPNKNASSPNFGCMLVILDRRML